MTLEEFTAFSEAARKAAVSALSQPETYIQLGIILFIYAMAYLFARGVIRYVPALNPSEDAPSTNAVRRFFGKIGNTIFPLTAIILLRISLEISAPILGQTWVEDIALTLAILLFVNSLIDDFVASKNAANLVRWIGLPIIFLHLIGLLQGLVRILESIKFSAGNIELSVYGITRVLIFGTLLFWLGRSTARGGREIISRQQTLDIRTREVASKLMELGIFFLIFLLLLQIMGINLTTLAVFGGALGVGIGFGLQAIASNFISGIIILLDRSVTLGDYVELGENGPKGTVRQLGLRSTTLETFDGKDIVVPNEKFITETFVNWTHKDHSQRYRVDFSVAYDSDVRKLVEIIKEVVASHPQVISGEHIPIEDRPDCEIDSFGDSGINMFVEFWMEGIDDGKNRVGGDLLLMILEALREHGFEIPFPQREVRVLNPQFAFKRADDTDLHGGR